MEGGVQGGGGICGTINIHGEVAMRGKIPDGIPHRGFPTAELMLEIPHGGFPHSAPPQRSPILCMSTALGKVPPMTGCEILLIKQIHFGTGAF